MPDEAIHLGDYISPVAPVRQIKLIQKSGLEPYTGYYLAGEPSVHPDEEEAIRGALRELDPRQIEIYGRVSPAQKFAQACSITDLARRVSVTKNAV